MKGVGIFFQNICLPMISMIPAIIPIMPNTNPIFDNFVFPDSFCFLENTIAKTPNAIPDIG